VPQIKPQEARELLAPVYNCIEERFIGDEVMYLRARRNEATVNYVIA
jgi:hypothetical protein